MEIKNREFEMLTTICYNNECIKTIQIYEFYMGNAKTPVQRLKVVEFKYHDGTIDNDRSYSCRKLIDESEELETEYKKLNVLTLTTIDYNDGSTKTTRVNKDYRDDRLPATFRYPNCTSD